MPAQQAGNFDANTRRQVILQPTQTRPTGGGTTVLQLPRVGFLAWLFLSITGSVAGTLSAPNAFGMASVVKRVRLTSSAGTDIINISGQGYHYIYRNYINGYFDPVPFATARNAVTATTFDDSMLLPVVINDRDALGLINLQNEQTQLQLFIDWETDGAVATGATVTATCVPHLCLFTVPPSPKDYPDFSNIVQIIETQENVGQSSGDYTYYWPRANFRYLQTLHGYGQAQAGADNWNRARLRLNQTTFIYDYDVGTMNIEYDVDHPAQRIAGVVPWDLMGSSGFAVYDKLRDTIDAGQYTDIASVITVTASGTLYTIRRMVVPLATSG